ncbi:hypothetical protein [Leucobacter luti]|uniref:hypothetical protein n=1 Tax=Leucobacter luti TaxID=340320 RepID=UPI001C693952|nr:hypothetical protein [Leucobacter luti]QYM76925.1 hypothetical protein K1X41_05985 [Leucobacter luti]
MAGESDFVTQGHAYFRGPVGTTSGKQNAAFSVSGYKSVSLSGKTTTSDLQTGKLYVTGEVDFRFATFVGDYRGALSGSREPGFTVITAVAVQTQGIVSITLNVTGTIPQGAGVDVWSGVGGALCPPQNRQAAAWLDGGYAGVAWIRPNGTIAVANRSGASRSSAQFTITYAL